VAAEFRKRKKDATEPAYGRIRSPEALGALARAERKRQGLTLERVYAASGLTTRFLSEFERGKPNASLGRTMQALQALGLEMVVLPRGDAERLLSQQALEHNRGKPTGEDAS